MSEQSITQILTAIASLEAELTELRTAIVGDALKEQNGILERLRATETELDDVRDAVAENTAKLDQFKSTAKNIGLGASGVGVVLGIICSIVFAR